MKDSDISDFRMWMDAQPDYCSYTRVRSFLSNLLGVNKAKSEVGMAKLQQDDEIKIIEKKSGNSGRRVFLKPLEPLTENNIRSVWNGSRHVSKDVTKIALVVHDKTGHDVSDVKEFMRDLDSAEVEGDSFRWKGPDEYGDEEEFVR